MLRPFSRHGTSRAQHAAPLRASLPAGWGEAGREDHRSEGAGRGSLPPRAKFFPMDWEPLVPAATAARAHAYAPYSHFAVGAALLMEDGSIHAAANVENCIPALSICAERNAMSAAASAGLRRPRAGAVVTDAHPPARPP